MLLLVVEETMLLYWSLPKCAFSYFTRFFLEIGFSFLVKLMARGIVPFRLSSLILALFILYCSDSTISFLFIGALGGISGLSLIFFLAFLFEIMGMLLLIMLSWLASRRMGLDVKLFLGVVYKVLNLPYSYSTLGAKSMSVFLPLLNSLHLL